LHLHVGFCAGVLDVFDQLRSAVRAVAVDLDSGGCVRALVAEHLGEQLGTDAAIRGVARRDHGGRDDLGVRVDGDVALVAVESTCCRLVSVTCLRVHRGDDAVLGHSARDAKDAVVALFQILSEHCREQLRSLSQRSDEIALVHRPEGGVAIARQLVHELLACRRVVPVACRLAGASVVVVALQDAAQLRLELVIGLAQKPSNRRADQRYRVLRGHRVIECRRVEHALATHQARLLGHCQHDLEDAVGPLRASESLAHVHEHRVHEAGVVEVERTRGVLPAQIERERVGGLTVAQAMTALQHHHHRYDARRHRAAPDVAKQVREGLVRK